MARGVCCIAAAACDKPRHASPSTYNLRRTEDHRHCLLVQQPAPAMASNASARPRGSHRQPARTLCVGAEPEVGRNARHLHALQACCLGSAVQQAMGLA